MCTLGGRWLEVIEERWESIIFMIKNKVPQTESGKVEWEDV